MPQHVCTYPNCPHPATYRGRCPDHARTHNRDTRRAGAPVYAGKRWQRTRDWQLYEHPLCDICGRIATDVHHRQDLADGGAPYNPDNLQSLCRSCHSRITRQRQL